MREHNLSWSQIPYHLYRLLIMGGLRSGKTNSLFHLISQQRDIDKIYSYAKDLYKVKYQLLSNKREKRELKHLNYFKAFIKYSNDMDDIYENIEEYNPNKKLKILIVFDEIIADVLSNKKLNPIVVEIFIRVSTINISLAFIAQSYFAVPKILN